MAALLGESSDVVLPIDDFSPAALAKRCGQRHSGNMGVIFTSLWRKGFIKISERNKNMFHVKRYGTADRSSGKPLHGLQAEIGGDA